MGAHLKTAASAPVLWMLALTVGALSSIVQAQTGPELADSDLKRIAAQVTTSYPRGKVPVGIPNFGAGTPYDDFVIIAPSMMYIAGETAGFDTFFPASGKGPYPASDWVVQIECCMAPVIDVREGAARGDRVILGTADGGVFFRKGENGRDDDFARITRFDYNYGFIQLYGSPSEYRLVHCSTSDGTPWNGYAVFYVGDGAGADLIAFVDDAAPEYAGPPSNGSLSLVAGHQFKYVTATNTTVSYPGTPFDQIGSAGKDTISAIAVDTSKRIFVAGQSEGDITGSGAVGNEIWVAGYDEDGSLNWIRSFQADNGAAPFDMATDNTYLYIVGRTFTNMNDRWDGFIYKLRNSDGSVARQVRYGYPSTPSESALDVRSAGRFLDGFGNIAVSPATNRLFVSGQGGKPLAPDYLVCAYDLDLNLIWEKFYTPASRIGQASEAWGGIATSGTRVCTAGWYIQPPDLRDPKKRPNSNAFAVCFNTADGSLAWPGDGDFARHRIIGNLDAFLDWPYGSAMDSAGNYYLCGFTTGRLDGVGQQAGEGDVWASKFDREGDLVWIRQWGTKRSESCRRMVVDESDHLYVVGYTYGDLARRNMDSRNLTRDVYVAKLSSETGEILAQAQYGSEGEETAYPSLLGDILYLAGTTEGSLTGKLRGAYDGFIMRLSASDLSLMSDAPSAGTP